MSITTLPATNIAELTDHVLRVSKRQSYFNRDLCLLERDGQVPQEIVLARILNAFFSFSCDRSQKIRFQAALSQYCEAHEKVVSQAVRYLFTCAKEVIHPDAPPLNTSTSPLELVLFTDADGHPDHVAAMGQRCLNSLHAKVAVIAPLQLLIHLIQFSQISSARLNYDMGIIARKVYSSLSHSSQWVIYEERSSQLVAVVPRGEESKLSLESCERLDWDKLLERSCRKCDQTASFDPTACVSLLSTATPKHLIWAGHGDHFDGKPPHAMGMELEAVASVLSSVPNVQVWHLHSCYILGNIRRILQLVHERSFHLLFAGGVSSPSSPLHKDESLQSYFWTLRRVSAKDPKDLYQIFSIASPWIDGLGLVNHTHALLRGSRQIIPLTFRGVGHVLSALPLDSEVSRVFIPHIHHKETLHLSYPVHLLSGISERDATHFFEGIQAQNISFRDFVKKAFIDISSQTPSTLADLQGEEREESQLVTHHGHLLFLIRRLECKEGVYEHVVCYTPGPASTKETLFFFKEGQYFRVDHDHGSWSLLPCKLKDIQNELPDYLRQSTPSNAAFEEEGLDKKKFYSEIARLFSMPQIEVTSHPPKPTVGSSHQEQLRLQHPPSSPAELFQEAVARQDLVVLETVVKKVSRKEIMRAVDTCVTRNRPKALEWLLRRDETLLQETYSFSIYGEGLLNLALRTAHIEVLRVLIDFKVPITDTSVNRAARFSSPEVVTLLLSYIEDNHLTLPGPALPKTPYESAVAAGNYDTARVLK